MNLSSSSKKLIIRVVLFLLYLLLGAAVFMWIEQSSEEKQRRRANQFIFSLPNFTSQCNSSEEDMKKFLLDLDHALRYGYDIRENRMTERKWTFMNSFYFVGNIVTTIGRLLSFVYLLSGTYGFFCFSF